MTVDFFLTTGTRYCFAWDISASFLPRTVMRTGWPAASQSRCSFLSNLPFMRPIACPPPVFFHSIRGNPVGFDMGRVNPQRAKIGVFLCRCLEYPLE